MESFTLEPLEVWLLLTPLNIKDDLSFPTVYLTGFQINNKEVIPRADSPLKHSIIHTNELELEYDQNFISFDFAVLKYAATTNDACCVRLEGLDKDWSYRMCSVFHILIYVRVSTYYK